MLGQEHLPLVQTIGAGDRTRTGDSLVGNEGLYQLSYSRSMTGENIDSMKNSVKVLVLFAALLCSCAPTPEALSPGQLEARHLNSLGVVAMDQHNYIRGRENFSAAVQLDPNYATAHANLGISLYSLGRYDSASVALHRALDIDEEHLHASYTLGLIYHAQGSDHERALKLFHHVARRDPEDHLVRYYLGRTQSKLGQADSAMAAFRRVIELDGANVSAYYALAQAQRQAGDLDGWRATLETFNRLSQAGLEGVSSAYQGQGKYAEAVADTPFRGSPLERNQAATFESAPAPAGLAPDASWLTAVDADSDGRVDLLTEGTDGQPQLLRDIGPRFEPSKLWDFGDMGVATAVTLADMDDDGDKDAAFSGSVAGIGLQDDGHFQPVTTDFDRCVDAVFGDLDHDGDADIACAGNKLGLWSNDGTGHFRDITASTEGDGARTRQVLFSDLDTDRDVDILTAGGTGFGLYSNNRDGTFTDVAATRGLKGADIRALAVADFAANGSMDVAAVSGSGASLFVNEGTQFTENSLDMVADANGLIGADLDNDGDIDLLAYGEQGVTASMSTADGFAPTEAISTAPTRVLVVVDVDDDGRLDVITPAALLFNRIPAGGSVRIHLAGLNSNPDAFGTRVEVKTASSRQVQELRGGSGDPPTLHFGIGAEEKVEFVRVLWPSGVRQTELDTVHTGRLKITEVNRKGTSCPILYAWDGERFRFVSDILGGAIIGYLVGPDQYYTPDSDEYLPVRQLAPTATGDYVLQIGNQLEEIIYLDAAELVAVDHPTGTELYPGERLLSEPPYPAFHAHALSQAQPLARITDGSDQDVTALLSHLDDNWYSAFERLSIHGYAEPYSLTLDLGDIALGSHPVLLAHGWVDYAHSSSNWAAAERGLALFPPRLEARSGAQDWRTVTLDMGVPAGLPKDMLYDLEGVFPATATDAQLRITTNTPVYWDRFLLGLVDDDASTQVHRRAFAMADLHWRGYPRHEAIHGSFAFRYDYDDVETEASWGTHGGAFTRYGVVTSLLEDIDDRFVVMFHGDEVTLKVAADSFPPLKPGWQRTFLFYADGFGKDMDHHSAHSLTVEPLPFHSMSRYPYGPEQNYPVTAEHVDYVLDYNTRWIKGYYR